MATSDNAATAGLSMGSALAMILSFSIEPLDPVGDGSRDLFMDLRNLSRVQG